MLGIYDFEKYPRGRVLYKGLKKNGILVDLFLPKGPGLLKYAKIARRILSIDYDYLLVTGKISLMIAVLLKPIHRKPIIFDAFISDYDTLVIDRKLVRKGSIKAQFLWWGDKLSCTLADLVILDTQEHIDYFVSEFGLPKEKFKAILIGADDDIFVPMKRMQKSKKFVVLFHGTFIPLQGIEHIIKAAKLLEKDEDILFELVGDGQTFSAARALANELKVKNVVFRGMMQIQEIPKRISNADVCLGIFGTTPKAYRVIPNKFYEAIAMGKPVITADTPAIRRIFKNGENCLLCEAGSAHSLAKAVVLLKKNPLLRKKIANAAIAKFKKECSPKVIGQNLINCIKEMI
ncbi:MAG: glycosyltransferase family 4 protein [Candidatus Woesearchaeota archaeon]